MMILRSHTAVWAIAVSLPVTFLACSSADSNFGDVGTGGAGGGAATSVSVGGSMIATTAGNLGGKPNTSSGGATSTTFGSVIALGGSGVGSGGTVAVVGGNPNIGGATMIAQGGSTAAGGTSATARGGATMGVGGTSATARGGASAKGGTTSSGGTTGTGGSSGGSSAGFWKAVTYSATGLPDVPSGNHNAGQNCLNCHTGTTGAPHWYFAGTVYKADGKTPAPNVQIGVNDGTNLYTAYSATNGNFYLRTAATINWASAQVHIRNSNGELTMSGAVPAAACNSCHTGTTNPRITAP